MKKNEGFDKNLSFLQFSIMRRAFSHGKYDLHIHASIKFSALEEYYRRRPHITNTLKKCVTIEKIDQTNPNGFHICSISKERDSQALKKVIKIILIDSHARSSEISNSLKPKF